MAYGPVNVPGAGAADMEQVQSAITAAVAQAQKEAAAAIEKLRNDLQTGAVKAQPLFPVLAADPESPEQGEAWIIKENTGETPEN